ncbi:carbonic anhydrase [Nostoc punctiforme]|uniref:carbonic anhydrase n=1 Tax=Nostoc punctiforme (strain ATCC 29133 / PCC 73102) TaxID=63737 RepID=B2J310_NOSP7|nr:carbonic anhydrase [Nostoc punctiforme]ACC82077.1 carbonic anhydrase [Nostoc punctiforme PCC 73102]
MSIQHPKINLSRRSLFKFGAGAIGTGVLTVGLGSNLLAAEKTPAAPAENDITPDKALQELLDGNERFVKAKRRNPNQSHSRLVEVAKGQKPFASVLGCADSRVPSEIVFDQGLGDLFVCRVAGNIATREEIGSLEFGSLVLGTKVIMVVGHERCGAVGAAIKGAQVPGQIGSLLEAIQPSVESTKGKSGDKLENVCKANILAQVGKLKSSSVLSELIKAEKLKIIGGYYDLDTGRISLVS